MRFSFVYIVTNKFQGTLYIGVTTDLRKRIFEHKSRTKPKGFTAKYNLDKLVYYEIFESLEAAIFREKKLKKFMRDWKVNLIEKGNPEWRDLVDEILGVEVATTSSSSRSSGELGDPFEASSLRDPRVSRSEPEDDVEMKMRNAGLKKEKSYA